MVSTVSLKAPRTPATRQESYQSLGLGLVAITWTTICALVTYGLPLVVGQSIDGSAVSVISIIVTVSLSFAINKLDSRWFVLYWVNLVVLQNVAAGLWHSSQTESIPFVVTEAKTIALAFVAVLSMGAILNLIGRSKVLLLALVLYGASLGLNFNSFGVSALANMRNFLTPMLIMFVAYAIAQQYDLRRRTELLEKLLILASFWLLIGAMGELIVGTQRWRSIFSAEALGGLNSLAEWTIFLGVPFARVGGLFIEPINAGYVAASVITTLLVMRLVLKSSFVGLAWWFCMASSLGAVILAATKNALLMIAILIFAIVALRFTRLASWVILCMSLVLSFVLTLAYSTYVKGFSYITNVWGDPFGVSGGESTSIHMAGLMLGFKSLAVNPMGHGIGSGGNFYRLANPGITREMWLSTGGESAWGTLAYQGGVLAILGLLLLLCGLARQLGGAATVLLSVWGGAALFAESFFGPIACSVLLVSAILAFVHDDYDGAASEYGPVHARQRAF